MVAKLGLHRFTKKGVKKNIINFSFFVNVGTIRLFAVKLYLKWFI